MDQFRKWLKDEFPGVDLGQDPLSKEIAGRFKARDTEWLSGVYRLFFALKNPGLLPDAFQVAFGSSVSLAAAFVDLSI